MLITDEKFFCEELNEQIPEMQKAARAYRESGLQAAEKVLADYVRQNIEPDKYFRIPYYERENAWALSTDDDFAAAEKIIKGELRSCGFTHKFENGEVDWEFNPTYNQYKEWTWQLSRHHEWRCLGYCYRMTGDEKYAQCFVKYLMSWCAQAVCPENAPSGATNCWRTIEAGIRMTKNWHYAFFAFINSPHMTDHVITTYMKSICEHGYRLSKFSSAGNWLIMEMAGLAHIAMLYPFLKKNGEWADYAFGRLASEIDVQVYPDGFQYELSTGYHGVVVQNYDWVINTAKAMEYKISDELSKNLQRCFELYIKLCQPDRHTPDINDGGRADVAFWEKLGSYYFPEREDFRYFATYGKEGKLPDYVSIALPYSGIAMMRTDWSKKAVNVFMESAPFGKAHQHEDKLNVLMFAYGKNVLRDTGNYAYDTSDMRKFVLDTRSHNCAMVDDRSQARGRRYNWKPEYIKERSNLKWKFSKDTDVAEGVYDEGYGPEFIDVKHCRKLIFFKKGLGGSLPFALVVDRFVPRDGKQHKYAVSYQMDIQPYTVENGIYTADFGDGVTMSVIGDVIPEIISGQKEPYMLGWRPVHKTEEHEHNPAPCLRYTRNGGNVRIITALYPSDNGECVLSGIKISDSFSDDDITLTFNDGKNITVRESDYPAYSDSPEKYSD